MLQLEQIGIVERLESLFEQSMVCVATVDAEGFLLSSNRAFQNTFGPIFHYLPLSELPVA